MILKEYMDLIGPGYPDGLERYVDENGEANTESGDTLATFVAREIADTFDPYYSVLENLDVARHRISVAMKDLKDLLDYLERTQERIEAQNDEAAD